jgi:hypothetical protein
MQFRVPQFIDIEDKVVGPLTLKQFGYILGAGGFSFLIWTFISIKIIAIVLILIVAGLFLSLAFLKINNRPFGDILESAFTYYTGSHIYTSKHPNEQPPELSPINKVVTETTKDVAISKANKDRLHELAFGLDVLDTHPKKEESDL